MSWNNAPEYGLTPKQRSNFIFRMFKTVIVEEIIASDEIFDYTSTGCSIKFQEQIIKKLESHGITSEYENEVLTELNQL